MFPTYLYDDDVEAAQDALRDGLDPDRVFQQGVRALHFNEISTRMVQLFVDWGADINAFDDGSILGRVRTPLDWTRCAMQCMLNNGAESGVGRGPYDFEFAARRDTILGLLLSIPGLPKGVALRVGWWVVKTH